MRKATAMVLVMGVGSLWAAGCGRDLADELRDLLAQSGGQGNPGGSGGGPMGGTGGALGGAAGQQPSPADIAAPRPISPLSGSLAASQQLHFRWELAPGTDGAAVDVCADRACQNIVGGVATTGSSGAVVLPLQGWSRVFWRLHGMVGAVTGTSTSPIWEAFLPPNGETGGPGWSVIQTRADFNGDGFTDFVLEDRVLLGGAGGYSGSFPIPSPPSDATLSVSMVAGDLNGDGFTDLLRIDQTAEGDFAAIGLWTPNVFFGGPNGFTPGTANLAGDLTGALYGTGPAGDVNGDGYADVLFKSRFELATFHGTPSGIVNGPAPAAETTQSFFAADGDVNADGYSDVVSNSNGEGAVEQSFGSAAGFAPAVTVPAQLQIGTLVMLEANGDQYSDLAFDSTGGLEILPGSPTGLLATPIVTIPGGSNMHAIGTGDFNRDSWVDLIVDNNGTLEVHYGHLGRPEITGAPLTSPSVVSAGTMVGSFGDVNGDGYDDLTVGVKTQDPATQLYHTRSAVLYLGGPTGLDTNGTPVM